MKLFVKNKLFSFGGSSFVLDESDNKVFKIKGKIFSPTRKKKIYDANGELRYVVRNKFWKMFHTTTFIFDPYKNLVAKISNNDFDFRNKHIVKQGEDEIEINGSFKNFEIVKNGKLIGTINRDFTIVRDAFTVEVLDPEEAAFMVALTICIDNIRDKQAKRA